jgi:hypothetical protein
VGEHNGTEAVGKGIKRGILKESEVITTNVMGLAQEGSTQGRGQGGEGGIGSGRGSPQGIIPSSHRLTGEDGIGGVVVEGISALAMQHHTGVENVSV